MTEKKSYESYSNTAFLLSLIAGILIIGGGVLSLLQAHYGPPFWDFIAPHRPMRLEGFRPFLFRGVAVFGLISGIIVLISALLLRIRPMENSTWGILLVVFSVLSLFSFGGFIIGAVLGIIGGALALASRTDKPE